MAWSRIWWLNGLKIRDHYKMEFNTDFHNMARNGQKRRRKTTRTGSGQDLLPTDKNGVKKRKSFIIRKFLDFLRCGMRTGRKRKKKNYMDGKLEGIITFCWYENGQKKSENNYVKGKITSAQTWKPSL